MNTIYKIKKYNNKKFTHEISRRQKRLAIKKSKKRIAKEVKQKNEFGTVTFRYTTEKVPDKFCLFTNTDECIKFFNKLLEYILDGKHLYIDMGEVKYIDASAIIFYLSMFKNLKNKNIKYDLRGNVPKNAGNYEYLYRTGFFNFVSSNTTSIEVNNQTVMIKESNKVENMVARDICDFIIMHTKKLKVEIKPFYEMIIELMNNTKHHAYENIEYVHNWYIYCQAIGKKVQIIFFDNGLGIPSTVQKKKSEELMRWLNNKGLMLGGDIDILQAALDGAFRTRTRKEHRGKGLPMINSLIQNDIIKNTKIITNHAFYSKSAQIDIHNSLQGTLYSWEVV